MGLDELWEKIKNSVWEAGKDFGEYMKVPHLLSTPSDLTSPSQLLG